MEDIQLEKKAKTHKGKKYLESLLPKLIEDPKQSIFINTQSANEITRLALNEIYLLRKDYSTKLTKKELIHNIAENKLDVQFLCEKNNASLFSFATDTKRNPMSITFGSLFNHEILDYFEFEITNFVPCEYFKAFTQIDTYMKPVLIFQGEIFESNFEFERVKKFFIDFFRLYPVENAVISELRRVIVFTCDNDEQIIKLRCYQVNGNIEEGTFKDVTLEEIGPSFDFKKKHFELANIDLYNKALKQPKAVTGTKEKNIEHNGLGEKRGRLHMQKQNLNAVSLRKFKKIGKKREFGKLGKKEIPINEEDKE